MSKDKLSKVKPSDRVRPIGEPREVTVRRELSDGQITELREELEVLLDDYDNIEEKKKEAAANFNSQQKTNELRVSDIRRKIKARHIDEAVLIQEYLTRSNEVIQIRTDTGDQVGTGRTAKPAELQEDMFPAKPADAAGQSAAPQPDAAPEDGFATDFGGDAS